ncbi:hypothetical protein ACOMHN_039792 [Nucella lapillus]
MDEVGMNYTDYYYYEDDPAYKFYIQCGLVNIPFYPEFRAAEKIAKWLYPFLLILGIFGNGVSVLILRQLSITAWSSALYLAVLALVDMMVLCIRCGSTWFHHALGVNPSMKVMEWSDAMCKCYLFVLNVLLQLWPWLMVAVSVDLAIASFRPLTTYRACTRERARVTILLITILLICLNLNFFWTWGLRDGLCIYIEEFSLEFLNVIWPSIESTVKHILPLLIVGTGLVITVFSLARSRRNGASYEPILRKYFLDLTALQQLKKVCLMLTVMFVLVKAFTCAVELINALELRGMVVVPCERYAHFQASFTLAQTLRDACVYSFHSLKFVIYVAFCDGYRRQVIALLKKCAFCRRVQKADGVPTMETSCVEENKREDH